MWNPSHLAPGCRRRCRPPTVGLQGCLVESAVFDGTNSHAANQGPRSSDIPKGRKPALQTRLFEIKEMLKQERHSQWVTSAFGNAENVDSKGRGQESRDET